MKFEPIMEMVHLQFISGSLLVHFLFVILFKMFQKFQKVSLVHLETVQNH